MSDGLLESIIQLEKSIQSEVAKEQVRAEEWQARELANLEKKLARIRQEFEEHRRLELEKKKSELEHEGAKLKAEAEDWCNRLELLEDSVLLSALRLNLAVILSEGDHDHPHGEG